MTLSTPRAIALYVGALLGPSLLLLPGLAAALAGPAAILAWLGLLGLSGLFAIVFAALGTRISSGGVIGYAAGAFGPRAGRAVGWCFLSGVVLGAPVVCVIGGGYLADLVGGGRAMTAALGAALLAAVVVVTSGGARATTSVQLLLVGALMVLVALAVAGSAGHMSVASWHPFAPHGWTSIGSAAAVLMLSVVGWEAVAPMTARLRGPAQLRRVIACAFAITAAVYLALAAATIGALGAQAGSTVPLADLLQLAVGASGRVMAAVAAVALTLAATNAYIAGAGELARLLVPATAGRARLVPSAIATVGGPLLAANAAGALDVARLVSLPTTLFVTVYLGCTAAAVRLLGGTQRVVAVLACVAVAVVLGFCGWALVPAGLVAIVGFGTRNPSLRRARSAESVVDARCGPG
jgi:amino acid efflux transporter